MTARQPVTDDQIERLRDEALRAGDWDQALICNRALAGSARARRVCARVITDARAQEEEADDD